MVGGRLEKPEASADAIPSTTTGILGPPRRRRLRHALSGRGGTKGDAQTVIKTMSHDLAKKAAGEAGARLVESGMTVGLGTGTTAAFFIEALAARVATENLRLRCVATSRGAEALAAQHGVVTIPLSPDALPDMTIDGADEATPDLHLIKGGGGALVREKLVAASSREMVVIVDRRKYVPSLGAFPLPVTVFPFGWQTTRARVEREFGFESAVRGGEDTPFLTDDGLYILDLPFGAGGIVDPAAVQARLHATVGVAEVGLFVGIARRLLIGDDDGSVEEIARP